MNKSHYVYCFKTERWVQAVEVVEYLSEFINDQEYCFHEKHDINLGHTSPPDMPPIPFVKEEELDLESFWVPFFITFLPFIFSKHSKLSSKEFDSQIQNFSTDLDLLRSELSKSMKDAVKLNQQKVLEFVDHKMVKRFNHLENLINSLSGSDQISSDQHKALEIENEKHRLQIETLKKEQEQSRKDFKTLESKYKGVADKLKLARVKIQELYHYKSEYLELKKELESSFHQGQEGEGSDDIGEQTTVIMMDSLSLEDKKGESQETLDHSTGDFFEAFNTTHWYVKKMNPEGPHLIKTLLEAKEKGELNLDSLVKESLESVWRPVREFVELCAPLKVVTKTDDQGQEVQQYLVKRMSYRAPFYEVVEIEVNGVKHRGYCTSLSLGGCFVELSRSDISKLGLEIGTHGLISFNKSTLDQSFSVEFEVRNIGLKKPKGVGVSFVNLEPKVREIVDKYVSMHMKQKNRAA